MDRERECVREMEKRRHLSGDGIIVNEPQAVEHCRTALPHRFPCSACSHADSSFKKSTAFITAARYKSKCNGGIARKNQNGGRFLPCASVAGAENK